MFSTKLTETGDGSAPHVLKYLYGRDAKCGLGRLTDLARANYLHQRTIQAN